MMISAVKADPRRRVRERPSAANRRRRPRWVLPVGTGVLLLVLWQVGAWLRADPLIPTPFGIIGAFPSVVTSPDFWFAFGDSSLALLEGILIGCISGTILGILIGRIKWVRGLTAPYVSGLYAMPMIALVPLATIWLGYSPAARLAMIIVAAILPSIVSTADGARHVPADLEDVMIVLGVSRARRLVDLVVPTIIPYIFAGINVAVGRAIVAAVAVEFLASVQGLGNFILVSSHASQQDAAFVGVLFLVALGLLAHLGIERARRRIAPWQHVRAN